MEVAADRHHHPAGEREIDMKYLSTVNIIGSFIAVFFVSGCYTQLMSPQEYVKIKKGQSSVGFANNSYSINYNQTCTSCHSVTELNERAEELEYYGIRTVHDGVLLSDREWLTENTGNTPYTDPGPIYWPTPTYPTYPWWVPPVSVITTPAQPAKVNRPRTDGSTRDEKAEGGRERPIPSPTYSQPSSPVGGTSSPSAPSTPAIIITPTPSSTPASQPAESGRSRETNNEGGTTTTKTRSDGSSRDSAGSRPR